MVTARLNVYRSAMGIDPGLCATCVHCQRVGNRRGSTFYLCGLHDQDANYPRYPRLPVLRCLGHAKSGEP